MEIRPNLDPQSGVPIYRQLGLYLQRLIEIGRSARRRPPSPHARIGWPSWTEPDHHFGRLRAAGISWLDQRRGRSGQLCFERTRASGRGLNWSRLLDALRIHDQLGRGRQCRDQFLQFAAFGKLFPVEEFRESCREVLESRNLKSLMQLGSPGGYEPLRRYLLDRAIESGMARESDDILITNGCQQALDILRRALVRPGDKVAVEEPVYPGPAKSVARSRRRTGSAFPSTAKASTLRPAAGARQRRARARDHAVVPESDGRDHSGRASRRDRPHGACGRRRRHRERYL